MERIIKQEAQAYTFQPGDGTRYQAIVTDMNGYYQVAIMNRSFADVISFQSANFDIHEALEKWIDGHNDHPSYPIETVRNDTNPWTIKAAYELVQEYIETGEKTGICDYCGARCGGYCKENNEFMEATE